MLAHRAVNARSDAQENGATNTCHTTTLVKMGPQMPATLTSTLRQVGLCEHTRTSTLVSLSHSPVANMLGTPGFTHTHTPSQTFDSLPCLSPKECFSHSLSLSLLGLSYLQILLHLNNLFTD